MKVIKYRMDLGVFNGLLVKTTAKKISLILMTSPIKVKTVPISESKYITEIDRPVRNAQKQLKAAARSWGNDLSTACRQYLNQRQGYDGTTTEL